MPTLLRPSGLMLKLAVFFLLCGVPALLALDAARTLLEFRQIVRVLDSATISAEVLREAQAISRHRRERGLSGIGLTRDLERWLLTLTQPSRSPFGETAFSLLEYGPQPFVAMLVDANEQPIATTRVGFAPPLPLSPAGTGGLQLAAVNTPRLQRLYRAPLLGPKGAAEALVLWADLSRPSERVWRNLSFEWPIVLVGAMVFATVAAVFLSAWVTRRLRRIATTADAWRHGRFDLRIGDRARDEIGELAQQLDTMPSALAELVEHRGERAGRHERERIARDLHDTIKQQAFALSMQLGALRAALPEAQRDLAALGEARALAEQIQHELAELLGELRPLPQAQWPAHLVTRIEDWSRRSGIAAHVDLDAAAMIAPSRHDVLVRVIDEALANVARHSAASHAQVRVSHNARRFTLCVEDDGRGGIVEGSGRGLQHLRERAAALPEGNFDWRSGRVGGSRIELHWTETVT